LEIERLSCDAYVSYAARLINLLTREGEAFLIRFLAFQPFTMSDLW
jgi:hypothetical protein